MLLMLLLLQLLALGRVAQAILTDGLLLGDDHDVDGGLGALGGVRCARRVQRELDAMRRTSGPAGTSGRRSPAASHQATIDLAGYALHQPLRSAPYDMYVTGMRVRVPGQTGWVRVERCQFDPHNQSLDTRLLFRDLTVTGRVQLYEDGGRAALGLPLSVHASHASHGSRPAGTCSMTLRLRRAGLGFTAIPASPTPTPINQATITSSLPLPLQLPLHLPLGLSVVGQRDAQRRDTPPPLEVRTNARFVDPDFVSVYAHGCPTPNIEHRADVSLPDEPSQDLMQGGEVSAMARGERRQDDADRDLSREMEDVFLRGIRTLLARYMERRLQPALRDAVMAGMGYSVSYGR